VVRGSLGQCQLYLATGRVFLAGEFEGDGPDQERHPVPPGWGLGSRITTCPCKNIGYQISKNEPDDSGKV